MAPSIANALSLIFFATSLLHSTRSSFRGFDFANALYPWEHPSGIVPNDFAWIRPPDTSIRLRHGRVDFKDQSGLGEGYLLMIGIVYGDLDGDSREDAAVDLIYSTGGTANWHYLYIFRSQSDHQPPRVISILRSGSRADRGLARTEIKNETLILDFF